MITFKIKKVKFYRPQVLKAVGRATDDPVRDCAALVETRAKQLLSIGAPVYMARRSRTRKTRYHVPSRPGTPPHLRTGALRSSVKHALLEKGGAAVLAKGALAIVGPTEPYGKTHEFGSRVHPQRPFMRPALLQMMIAFPAKFRKLKLRASNVPG